MSFGSSFTRSRRLSSSLCAAATLLASQPAGAETKKLGDGTNLAGDNYVYDQVIVGGKVTVRPHDPADYVGCPSQGRCETGWAYLRANSITIEETGVIDADGAGFQGTNAEPTADAQGPGFGAYQTPVDPTTPIPGGGGASYGNGGSGVDTSTCLLVPGAEGGMAHPSQIDPLNPAGGLVGLGSAGGASNAGSNLNHVDRGGSGGGVIILHAHTVTVKGVLRASGRSADGILAQDSGGGGGAGGTIVIIANVFKLGGKAQILASGGNGDAGTSKGGGGSGGVVVLRTGTPVDAAAIGTQIQAEGGHDPDKVCTVVPQGALGKIDQLAIPECECVDADGDGHPSDRCQTADGQPCGGGGDCDDGNPDVHPGQHDRCNGIDDDCSGGVDDPPADDDPACNVGTDQICVNGSCVDPEAPDAGAPDAGPAPSHIELRGGVCASIAPGSPSTAGVIAVWLAACAGLFAARRARRR